jgi:hypothetical protein
MGHHGFLNKAIEELHQEHNLCVTYIVNLGVEVQMTIATHKNNSRAHMPKQVEHPLVAVIVNAAFRIL